MKNKFILGTIITFIISIFCVSYSFADNSMLEELQDTGHNMLESTTNGIKDVVGGTENMINNTMDTTSNEVNTMEQDATNSMAGIKTDSQTPTQSSYTADRTSSTSNIAGFPTSYYSWFIVGITAIAVGVLVWSYISHNNTIEDYNNSSKY